jgi:hypothetical protein
MLGLAWTKERCWNLSASRLATYRALRTSSAVKRVQEFVDL